MRILLSLFVLVMVTTSCKSSKERLTKGDTKVESLSGTYSISQIVEYNSVSRELSITLEESTNSVSGFAGCNNFFGTYSLDQNRLTFKNIATTKKFCEKEVNEIENQLITVLNSINTFSLNEDVLSFFEDDTVLLIANKRNHIQDN